MIRSRASDVSRLQSLISASVRKHPRQRPDAPSTMQTWTQGVAIDCGGWVTVR